MLARAEGVGRGWEIRIAEKEEFVAVVDPLVRHVGIMHKYYGFATMVKCNLHETNACKAAHKAVDLVQILRDRLHIP